MKRPRWLPGALVSLLGAALLAWLGSEDSALAAPWLLSAALTGLFMRLAARRPRPGPIRLALAGALAGGAIPALAALLMAVKVGLHSHRSPDYAPETVLATLTRLPAWLLAGLLLGLARAWLVRQR